MALSLIGCGLSDLEAIRTYFEIDDLSQERHDAGICGRVLDVGIGRVVLLGFEVDVRQRGLRKLGDGPTDGRGTILEVAEATSGGVGKTSLETEPLGSATGRR